MTRHEKHKCGCAKCSREELKKNAYTFGMRMIICEHCSNKRCPHAEDHDYICTGSNEPNQPKTLQHPRE